AFSTRTIRESGRAAEGERRRALALAVLDMILAKSRNRATRHRALQKEFSESPLRFFKKIIMPC
ncbi:MAG: hypothetical protein WCR06_09235, partial [bacterium]